MTLATDSVRGSGDALARIADAAAKHGGLSSLFDELAVPLRHLSGAEYVVVCLHDPARQVVRVHVLGEPADACPHAGSIELPVADSPVAPVLETQQSLLIPDLALEERFPLIVPLLRESGVASCFLMPLGTARRRLGAIGIGRTAPGAPTAHERERLAEAAQLVAVAVEGALEAERTTRLQAELAGERDRLRLLLEVSRAVASELDLGHLLDAIGRSLEATLAYEFTSITLLEPGGERLRAHALRFPGGKGLLREGDTAPIGGSPAGWAIQNRRPLVLNSPADAPVDSDIARRLIAEGLRSGCCFPLIVRDRVLGTLDVASLREHAFGPAAVELVGQVAMQIAPAVDNALNYRRVEELKDKLAQEKLYLEGELSGESQLDMIGTSPGLQAVQEAIRTVAPTDAAVLILGETGTGKELVARALHELSPRRGQPFVKINCAAIPGGLLESELFGHEKGAFTGALARKVGRFELAHRGTLFLDEVGEIPSDLQPKLLRVLQEQQFERIGGTKTTTVDVRIVAATNRDLAQMVADHTFRSDLYYRLNVFPVRLPPLRDRPGDVPLLVRHFVARFARRFKRSIEVIPEQALEALARSPWPGNVRELENLVERSVIVSRGRVLEVPLAELQPASAPPASAGVSRPDPRSTSGAAPGAEAQTLVEAERRLILKTLEETGWVIGGAKGAAQRLGINRTTLNSRMQKLGIFRPD